LSGNEVWLNSDLIQHLEATPDTVVTLIDGHRVVVQESPAEVQARHIAFRADILQAANASALDEARAAIDGIRTRLPGGRENHVEDIEEDNQ